MSQTTGVRIRPATANDETAIKAAIKRAGLDRTGLDWRRFKVAETETGEMRGICQVRRYWDTRELGSLYVRASDRGQGVGGALIGACLAEESPPVHLECVEARQSYYEQHGFQRIPVLQAPRGLRLKSAIGGTLARIFVGQRVIVMRWDGSAASPAVEADQWHEGNRG